MDYLHGFIKMNKCTYDENGEDYPFLLEDDKLLIFPPNIKLNSLAAIESFKALKISERFEENKAILVKLKFCDGTEGEAYLYDMHSMFNGLLVYTIKYLVKHDKSELVKNFCIESSYLNELANKSEFVKSDKLAEDFDLGVISILNDKEIQVSIRFNKIFSKSGANSIEAYLNLKCEHGLNTDEIIFLNNVCRKFFCFISYSLDAQIENSYAFGISKMKTAFKEFIYADDDKNVETRILSLENIKQNICKLIEFVSKDIFYFEYFTHTSQKYNYGFGRLVCLLACFERYAEKQYGDIFKRSEQYREVKDSVIEYLKQRKEEGTGKVRKYYSEIINLVSYEKLTYGDQIAKVIGYNENIMRPIIDDVIEGEDYNKKLQNLKSKLNKLRNDLAHAKVDMKLDKSVIENVIVVEVLLYVIAFKIAGIDDDAVIKSCLHDLFSIEFMS